jgi:hypothetical protein
MATNLLIGSAEIPNLATSSSINNPSSPLYPYVNLFGGNKTDLHYLETATSGDTRISLALPSGTTKACNFVYIGRANLLQQASVGTITIKANSANDYATATTIHTISSFGSEILYGPNDDDYIAHITPSPAYRYWFINYNATSASKIPHAKFFLGSSFDPGIDPNAPATITRIKQGGSQRRPTYSFEFTWNGMAYAKAVQMYLKFYRTRRYTPVIISTSSWHDILMGNRVIYCRLTEMNMPPRVTDYCDVTATFEEMP